MELYLGVLQLVANTV